LYDAAAAPKAWSARINGVLLYSSTNNTVSFSSSPTLGDYLGTRYFGGDVAEVLVYNRPLNDSERDFVGRYLNGRFALMTSPAAPTNLTAKPISSNQVSLAWIATLSNTGVKFVVERKTSVGGPYAVLAVVDGGASF